MFVGIQFDPITICFSFKFEWDNIGIDTIIDSNPDIFCQYTALHVNDISTFYMKLAVQLNPAKIEGLCGAHIECYIHLTKQGCAFKSTNVGRSDNKRPAAAGFVQE